MKKNKSYSNLVFFLLFVIFLVFPQSCDKENLDVVPDVFLDITINTINYSIGVTQSITISNVDAGVPGLGYDNNGIIIYRNGPEEFYAFDRTCPFHVEKSIPVELWTSSLIAICPVCSTKYILSNEGFPSDQGPSIYPLKQYHADFNPNNFDLHVYNF